MEWINKMAKNMEIWKCGDMERWRNVKMEIWRYGGVNKWIDGDMEIVEIRGKEETRKTRMGNITVEPSPPPVKRPAGLFSVFGLYCVCLSVYNVFY